MGRIGDDRIAHVPDCAAPARHIPAAPALLQRASMVRVVAAQISQRRGVGPDKLTAHQHSRNAQSIVGIVALQAPVLARELWLLLIFLRKTVKDGALLGRFRGYLNKSTSHPP